MKNPGFIDRTETLNGQVRNIRDHRVPYTAPRLIQNFSLPDKKPKRRKGYAAFSNHKTTMALCKATGVKGAKRLIESDHTKGTVVTTPLSYGLIRWGTDFQLRRAEPKTIEFSFKLGELEDLVVNPFERTAEFPGQWIDYRFRSGVYLLDQTIISNHHKFETGKILSGNINPVAAYDMGAVAGPTQFDVLPLTTMAFRYDINGIYFDFGMVDASGGTIGRYRHGTLTYLLGGSGYIVGTIYHLAVTYDPTLGAGPGRFQFYVNGVLADTLDIPNTAWTLKFTGEYDVINGVTFANGQHRDIVLLNECTVRGSYSSACKIRGDMHGHQTFFHNYNANPNVSNAPWCLSPPRGTAMWDLRIWNSVRTSTEVTNNKYLRILKDAVPAALKGNWHLADGGPVCENHITGSEKQYCTIHHGYPGYVPVTEMLSGQGVKLADGQHIIKSIRKNDRFIGSGFAAQLCSVFSDQLSATATLQHRDQHSFTVMMQVMVPASLQPELNDKATDPAAMRDLALVENRRYMNTGAGPYDMEDGQFENNVTARNFVGHLTDPVPPYNNRQSIRAYDQTLWSIEGTQRQAPYVVNVSGVTGEPHRRRIPVARGVITPDGHLAFELWKARTGGAAPAYMRLLSSTQLIPGHVYNLSFVQRALYVFDPVTGKTNASGWQMEIWVGDVTLSGAMLLDSSYVRNPEAIDVTYTSPLIHEQNYDISIGASYVNDGWDQSIEMPFPVGVVPTPKTIYVPAPSTKRENHGPWPVQQRFMSPYQDQPADIVVGMFRMWTLALESSRLMEYSRIKLAENDQSVDLIVNLEFSEITGTTVVNKSRYPDPFSLGYKGWGMPQGFREFTYLTINNNAYLKKEMFEGAWSYEDCLGYTVINNGLNGGSNGTNQYVPTTGLAPFKASTGQEYGLVSIFGEAPMFDKTLGNSIYEPLYVNGHGLMSEFTRGQTWKGTIVGDRTFLTSPNALPKVFNGKTLTVAGFKQWSGGVPVVYATATAISPGITGDKWYGVAVVYFSERYAIYQVSPVVAVNVDSQNAIGIYMVPPHPDSRVSLVEVYRTLPQETEDLALNAPLFKTRIGAGAQPLLTATQTVAGGNAYCESIVIDEPDTLLATGAVLDRNVTSFPICAYSAGLNERLYLGGDSANPNTVYMTDASNPERIDAFFSNIQLPEGSGDVQTGLVAAFGALFVFKSSAIWRIDDIGGNRHQVTKIASIGAAVDKSIQVINDTDSGRTWIFFWSQHGPYLFDGNTPIYIGQAIEEYAYVDSNGISLAGYGWLDISSLVVAHDPEAREIICLYKPRRADGTILSRNGRAIVFNYRNKMWYSFTGMIGSVALSMSFLTSAGTVFKTLLGGGSGKVYSWGEKATDAVTSVEVPRDLEAIIVDGQYTIENFPYSQNLVSAWLTFYDNATGNFETAPILATDEANDYVYVDASWFNTPPSLDSVVYIGQPPALIEFPWDDGGTPFYDKEVVELITWINSNFWFRIGVNFIPSTEAWSMITAASSKNVRSQIKRNLETIKLELCSREVNAALDGYAYELSQKGGANTKQ